MYDVISRRLKENGVTAFNTGSGDRIGVSKSSLSRFIRVGLQRRDVRKIGKDQYEIVPNITDVIPCLKKIPCHLAMTRI